MDTNQPPSLQATRGEPIVLKGVRVEGDLRGLLYEAVVEQRFVNENASNIEVVYTFPLPWGAVLLGVDATLGDKRLTGSVVARRRAEERYEAALSEGDAAVLLERLGDGTYTLNLGNLMPGEACVIALRYAQTLRFEQGGIRLVIPTVIAPRYGNPLRDGRLAPHQVPEHDLLALHRFDIVLRLHGDLADARVASPSHPVAVARRSGDDDEALVVSLARRGALDRDFVLVADQLAHPSMAVSAVDMAHADLRVTLASFCPRFRAQRASPLAVKLLVDCSGSMAGDSIDAARRALRAVVGRFADGDRFTLSRFGSTVENRSRALWKVTGPTRLAAQRWVDGLEADLGGTEMGAALESVFALGHAGDTNVLMVTDGEVYAIDAIIDTARGSGHRVFVVGIGSSPSESNLRRLAEATGGACDFVAPGETVEPAVLRMFARLRSPRLTDLALQWPDNVAPGWVSALPAAVFDGDTVNVFVQWPAAPQGALRLMGRREADAPVEEIARCSLAGAVSGRDALSRMAASVRIGAATGDASTGGLVEAVAYQLVTDETHFLMVHQRADAEKAADMPALHKVPQMVAAGWGGTGSVLAMRSMPIASDDVADLAAPASFRIASSAAYSVRERSPSDARRGGRYELPAFLQSTREDRSSPERFEIDQSNPEQWSTEGHYTGLTPLGLALWLSTTALDSWPQTFDALREIGLGDPVIDWLDLVVGGIPGSRAAESELVAALLDLFAEGATVDRLQASARGGVGMARLWRGLKAMADWFAGTGSARVDQALVARLRMSLGDMRAGQWPDAVFAMELAG